MNIWTPTSSAPPVSAAQIQAWEQQQGVRMPAPLREAMMMHNGGTLVDSFEPSIDVRPLEEWDTLEEDDLELFDLKAGGPPYVVFADNGHGGYCILNYHRCNAAGEPAVATLYQDGLDLHEEGEDVAAFLGKLSSSFSDKPSIDGSYAAHLTRLGQTQLVGKKSALHCLVGRDVDGRLVCMSYSSVNDEERWTASVLPEPLKRSSLAISHDSHNGLHGYRIGICTQRTEGVREWTSGRQGSGKWKNDFSEGSSGSTDIYSLELEPLILLRQMLAGPPQTQAQAEADTLRIEYLRLMATCSQRERQAADFYLDKVAAETSMDSFDKDFGLDETPADGLDDDLAKEDAAIAKDAMDFLSGKSGLMGKVFNAATTLLGNRMGKVPESTRNLIERLVAAEAAVEQEES